MKGGMSKKSTPPQNWREARRMRAWELHEQGWKQKDIAIALGVTEGAVSQWFKKAKAQGVQALQHQSPPGRQAQLSPEQMAQLPELLASVPWPSSNLYQARGAPLFSDCRPTLRKVDGFDWLLNSVAIQSAERTELETRTSSIWPGKKATPLVSPII